MTSVIPKYVSMSRRVIKLKYYSHVKLEMQSALHARCPYRSSRAGRISGLCENVSMWYVLGKRIVGDNMFYLCLGFSSE